MAGMWRGGVRLAWSLCLVACSGPEQGEGDAGGEDVLAGGFDVELGESVENRFESFEEPVTLEVVSGFQGGFHVEPALTLEGVEPDRFFAVVEYEARDVESGERLSRVPSLYRVDETAFEMVGGAWVRHYDRIILDVPTPAAAVRRRVEVVVRVEIEGRGMSEASRVVEFIDEVDELGL